jgi:hypothetical protein
MEYRSSSETNSKYLTFLIPRFIVVFTRARHCTLLWPNWTESTPSHYIAVRSILIISSPDLPNGFLPSDLLIKILCICMSSIPSMRATCLSTHIRYITTIILIKKCGLLPRSSALVRIRRKKIDLILEYLFLTKLYTGCNWKKHTNFGRDSTYQNKKKRPYHHVSGNIRFVSYSWKNTCTCMMVLQHNLAVTSEMFPVTLPWPMDR